MREFFEAGGRAYEVYLSYQDRQRSLPDWPVLPSRCPPSSPTKDNRKQQNVDQLPPQTPDVAAKTFGNGAASPNPSVLTVVNMTATCGSPTSSRPIYTQTPPGQRSHGHFVVTSQGQKDIGAARGYVAADVIDRVIASRLGLQDNSGSLFAADALRSKDTATERPINSIITPMSTLSETPLTTSPITSSSPNPVSSISTTSATLPSTTTCTSPTENVEGKPSNRVDLRDNCPKRPLTADVDPELAVDLSTKRRKSADDEQCGTVNQPNSWRKEATPIDRQKAAIIETDGKGVTRPSIAGIVPTVVYQSATIFSDVTLWSVDQVVRFVANVQGCREYAEIFRQEEIDGACLIRLSESHLLNVIRMKLGPALRLRQAIASLCSLDATI